MSVTAASARSRWPGANGSRHSCDSGTRPLRTWFRATRPSQPGTPARTAARHAAAERAAAARAAATRAAAERRSIGARSVDRDTAILRGSDARDGSAAGPAARTWPAAALDIAADVPAALAEAASARCGSTCVTPTAPAAIATAITAPRLRRTPGRPVRCSGTARRRPTYVVVRARAATGTGVLPVEVTERSGTRESDEAPGNVSSVGSAAWPGRDCAARLWRISHEPCGVAPSGGSLRLPRQVGAAQRPVPPRLVTDLADQLLQDVLEEHHAGQP